MSLHKKIFIIHGWDGCPEEGWFPWLKKKLEAKGFSVLVPQLPNPEEPRIKNWVPALKKIVDKPDEQTYFIGHSMGCQAIVRYLETLPEETKIGGAVFVAGFFNKLTNLEDDNVVHDVVKEWLKTSINLHNVKKHLKNSIAIFSDNDPYVPIDNKEDFEKILKSKIIIEHNMGHFSERNGIKELPAAFEAVLDIAKIN